MDAQDAAVSDPSKATGAAAASESGQQQQPQQRQEEQESRPLESNPEPDRQQQQQQQDSKPSSAASPPQDDKPQPESSVTARSDDAPEDRDSDAETIVLPGKDGHSPSKPHLPRKVRQEDRSESDGDAAKTDRAFQSTNNNSADKPLTAAASRQDDEPARKKHLPAALDKDRQPRQKDVSSGLSSAPTSPPPHQHHHSLHHHSHHPSRRRSIDARSSLSDSEHSQYQSSSKTSYRDKSRPGDRLLPHKRKAPKAESDDEADSRKIRRQRTTSAGLDGQRLHKDFKQATKGQHEGRNRSASPPHPRQHRRSISNQLPSHLPSSSSSLAQKKKRLPPPLLPPDYPSDESSASGSPHPRSSKLRSLATPATADSTTSPAKMAPHKKHLDAHGQTLLARACARGEYDVAKQRLGERPEDLNVADYAGNTPLQIAAINGCEDIVKLLIEAGCNLDCVNYDKDTPLLDAVDNGHLGVVRLLLEAGVNPRKANVNGEEPIDRVTDETENAEEIRAALTEARKRAGERRRTSEDGHSHLDFHETRDSHAPDSPRQSPVTAVPGAASSRRSGTVRSTKTRNDLLYMPLDDKTLRQAAGRGDEETVARILQVKEGYDDPESMVAAARGGHDLVIQLLLGLGGANPDPAPVPSLQSEFATPILAAIGQENIKVVELLLEQQGFDPTRRYKGETYYEIARRRQGTNWKDEEHKLKNAYDEYKRSHKDSAKTKSPGRRERDKEKEEKRARREEAKEEARNQRKILYSPTRDSEPKRKLNPSRLASPKDTRRPEPSTSHAEELGNKRGPGRPRRDDRVPSINVSDREVSPTLSHKTLKTKRTESDIAAVSSEGETLKPRRKLVSKGELKGEREKQRRASMASNASSMKEPSSPRENRNEEPAEKPKVTEKYHDRTKAIRRDDSKDRFSVSGEGSTKRSRASITPDRSNNGDKDESDLPVKRRRLETESSDKRIKRAASADGRGKQASSLRDGSTKPPAKAKSKDKQKDRDEELKDAREAREAHRRESGRSSVSDRSIHVKSEDMDLDMPDVIHAKDAEADARAAREAAEEELAKKRRKKAEEAEASRRAEEARKKKKEEESKRREEELKKEEEAKRKEEEAKRREKEEEAKKEEAKKQEELKRIEAEEKKKRELEEARKREEEEARRKAEEERKQKEEEEERKIREEAERQRREAEEAERQRQAEEAKRLEEEAKRKEEAERKQREEERLRKEQLERKAAEEARRQREEEERKERERRERAHREELERKRAAREAEQRRLREEQRRARLEKLPPLLQWLELCSSPKTSDIARRFWHVQGVRYDTIQPNANHTPEGREQWVLNTDVALLLGEKDLDLSRYTAWDRVPVSVLAKKTLWNTEGLRYSLTGHKYSDLRRDLPECYGGGDPAVMSFETRERIKNEARDKFLNLDMFFVKASDLLYTVPNIPHLRNVKLAIGYREVAESETQQMGARILSKWKQDPDADRYHGFSPRNKYYVNGVMVDEDMPKPYQTSKTPFPEKRVPRRGLVQVFPDDPDYDQVCKEQGLEHLLKNGSTTPLPNGDLSPTSTAVTMPIMNGTNGTNGTNSTNGTNGHTEHGMANTTPLVATNGIVPHGVSDIAG
ncbi:hypothetical protein S40288_05243 [Stachybotrys chartarum IBT 40288]|nr:hypothetical protein S40288_05243 [Stachybotrys chartarum IBT 40288]